jgi:signal transduction histidine kinase
MQNVRVADWVARVLRLESRMPVRMTQGPDVSIRADPDQLDQLLINIVRNAVDASMECHGGVSLIWKVHEAALEVTVDDEGHGIANPSNLFVPFFTTKPSGSGIGLFLSRQIAEAHGGTLALKNREPGPGCRAVITLPA